MALTTLLLRLRSTKSKPGCTFRLFRSIGSGLLILCFPLVAACGPGGESSGDSLHITPTDTPPTSPAGTASVSLAWDAVQDPSVSGYFVYYGTHSTNSFGSCAYSTRVFTRSPTAMVHGLTRGTQYFFAVSAYNGLESHCSAEVSTVTQSI